MWPAQGKRSIGAGMRVSIRSGRGTSAEMRRAAAVRPGPTRAETASARFASVAERPHVTSPGRNARSRASASSVCTPRLVESSSCHSSTTTVSSAAKTSWASSSESRIESDSGVVTSAVGQRSRSRRRAAADVSPVRSPTSQPVKAGRSVRSGSSSARTVSPARARSGVTHRTRGPTREDVAHASSPTAAPASARASAPSHAASVFPVPVGACSTPLVPASTARHVSSWNGNGDQPRRENQSAKRSTAAIAEAACRADAVRRRGGVPSIRGGIAHSSERAPNRERRASARVLLHDAGSACPRAEPVPRR